MSKTQHHLQLIWMILINLIPLVWLYFNDDWKIEALIQLYWLENIIIGAYLILKILLIPAGSFKQFSKNIFSAAFFIVHFGGFCAIHGLLIYSFFAADDVSNQLSENLNTNLGPLIIIELLFRVILHTWNTIPVGFQWTIFGMIITHGFTLIQNYLATGNYKTAKPNKLAKQPYQHIIIMHAAIIACAVPISIFNSPVILLAALIIGKAWLDIYLWKREHNHIATPLAIDNI